MIEKTFHEYLINTIEYAKKLYGLTQEEVDEEIGALAADIGFRKVYEEKQRLLEKINND